MVTFANPRSRHPYHMHDMILGQPAFVQETLDRLRAADAASFLGNPRRLLLTGCGTSYHAAMYGARILQVALGSTAAVHAMPAYGLLQGDASVADATVLGVSHSGTTPTTNHALARARAAGARVLALCGLPDSAMSALAEQTLVIGTTHDHSWANTMSYTTQLTALAWLAGTCRAGDHLFPGEQLASLPRLVRRALGLEDALRGLSRRIAKRERVTFLGTGLDEITALEAALKIRETCGLAASGYHLEQFLHGPFLSMDRGDAMIALRSRDDRGRAGTILRAFRATGADVTTIGEGSSVDHRLPASHPALRPILSVVPLQFVAYYAALAKKTNPDLMRSEVARYQTGLEALFH